MIDILRITDITKSYNVSDKAVRNWIDNAKKGKVPLKLIQNSNREYIANTAENHRIISELAYSGKKFRNRRSFNDISPSAKFYNLYSQRQIIDIASSIQKYKEIPSHYRYFGSGADYWNEYLSQLYSAEQPNLMNSTWELLYLDHIYLETILKNYDKVNLIDLGVGNGLGAKPILEHLLKLEKLNKYIGIDCSQNLMNITVSNIDQWFNGAVATDTYVRDIAHERFSDIATTSKISADKKIANLVLFLGGTIGNFRDPSQALSTIRDSLDYGDILLTSDELDSENARAFAGFDIAVAAEQSVIKRNTLLLNLLGIDKSLYEIEQLYDSKIKCRLARARLKSEININFKLGNSFKTVNLKKNELLVLFRMWEWTGHELEAMYEGAGFSQIRTTRLHHPEYVLMLSRVSEDTQRSLATRI